MHEQIPQQRDHYRRLAPYYDTLGRVVFGGAIERAQYALLKRSASQLKSCAHIVWIGGGTGRVINTLCALAPHAIITYLEPSTQMMRRAQTLLKPQYTPRVRWVLAEHSWLFTASREELPTSIDAIFTAFFLDVLPRAELSLLVAWATDHVRLWLLVDFVPQRGLAARALIGFMYLCFALTTQIKQRRLLNHQRALAEAGWGGVDPNSLPLNFASRLIEAELYRSSNGERS